MYAAMETWQENLVTSHYGIELILRATKTIAVLGIKTEAASNLPAFYVPEYIHRAGYEMIPVPIYYPNATEILGQRVFRSLAAIGRPIDMVNVFRRSEDIPPHVDDILAAKPKCVWFQSGIRNDEAARALCKEGIKVVQDRCLMVEDRRLRGTGF
jgi:predicted CoA-binding protein